MQITQKRTRKWIKSDKFTIENHLPTKKNIEDENNLILSKDNSINLARKVAFKGRISGMMTTTI